MGCKRIVICAIMCLVLASPAGAGAKYFYNDGNPDNWNDGARWFQTGCGSGESGVIPGLNDDAFICPGEDCTLDINTEIQTINVMKDGEDVGILRIPGPYELTLNQDGGNSQIDGHLLLTGEIKLDWANPSTATHIFSGDGDIQGTTPGARIVVEGSGWSNAPVLTNSTTIHGILQILHSEGDDAVLALVAPGTIHADAGGLLEISMSWMSDQGSNGDPLLKVSADPDSVLSIDLVCNSIIGCAATCLEYTNVDVFDGTFTFKQTFATAGTLTMRTGGRVSVPDDVQGWFDTTCGD